MKYGKLFFMKVGEQSDDALLQYLRPIVVASCGASLIALDRSIIKNSYEQHGVEGCKFVLDNSDESESHVYCIAFARGLLKEEHAKRVQFIIAHEIGHFEAGDAVPGNAAEPLTELYLEREIAADKFANEVLESTEGCIETLSYIHKAFTSPEVSKITGIDAATIALSTKMVEQRMAMAQ
jgi:hypothetical protein